MFIANASEAVGSENKGSTARAYIKRLYWKQTAGKIESKFAAESVFRVGDQRPTSRVRGGNMNSEGVPFRGRERNKVSNDRQTSKPQHDVLAETQTARVS